jgi:hypothetical protein
VLGTPGVRTAHRAQCTALPEQPRRARGAPRGPWPRDNTFLHAYLTALTGAAGPPAQPQLPATGHRPPLLHPRHPYRAAPPITITHGNGTTTARSPPRPTWPTTRPRFAHQLAGQRRSGAGPQAPHAGPAGGPPPRCGCGPPIPPYRAAVSDPARRCPSPRSRAVANPRMRPPRPAIPIRLVPPMQKGVPFIADA